MGERYKAVTLTSQPRGMFLIQSCAPHAIIAGCLLFCKSIFFPDMFVQES